MIYVDLFSGTLSPFCDAIQERIISDLSAKPNKWRLVFYF